MKTGPNRKVDGEFMEHVDDALFTEKEDCRRRHWTAMAKVLIGNLEPLEVFWWWVKKPIKIGTVFSLFPNAIVSFDPTLHYFLSAAYMCYMAATCWAVASTYLVWIHCKIQKIERAELLSAQQLEDHCNPWLPEQEIHKKGYKLRRAFDYMKNVGLHREEDYRYVGVKDTKRMAVDGGRPYNEQELLDILSIHPVVISYPCYREVAGLKKVVFLFFSSTKLLAALLSFSVAYVFCNSQDEVYEFIKKGRVKSLYWLVKSSWGERWADDGYGKIRRVEGEVPFHSFYPVLYQEVRDSLYSELQEMRAAFTSQFEKEFVSCAIDLRNNCGANPKEKFKIEQKQNHPDSTAISGGSKHCDDYHNLQNEAVYAATAARAAVEHEPDEHNSPGPNSHSNSEDKIQCEAKDEDSKEGRSVAHSRPSEGIVFDESDKETRSERGGVPMSRTHDMYVDIKHSAALNEGLGSGKGYAIQYEDTSEKDSAKLPRSQKRFPFRSQAGLKTESAIGNTKAHSSEVSWVESGHNLNAGNKPVSVRTRQAQRQ
ncbi:hypothetical protein Vadar_027014 [Vaccinium darrowii]|uniref:Uncharacterized protein n=1 Tax=Vaccinium darrowii TaxID=229202 RepID=A0ACB7X493_9ERIC|nr:hypothetical protein Vadar_027014 [Vaccinium darrowii]